VSAEIIELPVHPADPASQLIYPSAECNQTGANCAKSLGRPLQGSRPFHLGESSDVSGCEIVGRIGLMNRTRRSLSAVNAALQIRGERVAESAAVVVAGWVCGGAGE
jgi:hypothetical protein